MEVGTWRFVASYSVWKTQLMLVAHVEALPVLWVKNAACMKKSQFSVKRHPFGGACCQAHAGTFCLSLPKRIALGALDEERPFKWKPKDVWKCCPAKDKAFGFTRAWLPWHRLHPLWFSCLGNPQKHCTHAYGFGGVGYYIYFLIYYFFTLCKS